MSEGRITRSGNVITIELDGKSIPVTFDRKDPSRTARNIEKAFERFLIKDRTVLQKVLAQVADEYKPVTPQAQKDEGAQITPDEWAKIEAERILNSKDPLAELKPYLDQIIVAEFKNKQLIFILSLSGKYPSAKDKQIIVMMGTPGAGKSNLSKVRRAFKTKEVGRFTSHALDYTKLDGVEILYIKEIGYMDKEDTGVSTVKFVSSEDGGYTVEYTVRDEDGRFTTEQSKIPPITVMTTTARIMVESQFERRTWPINPDESEEQTRRIFQFKAYLEKQEAEVQLGVRAETDHDRAFKVLKAVVDAIESRPVIIPFPKTVTQVVNPKVLRARGDIDKVYTLVRMLGLLCQRVLPTYELDGKKVTVVLPSTFRRALDIATEALITMTTQLDHRVRKLIPELKNLHITEEGREIDGDARTKIAKALGVSEKTVKRYLDVMAEKGYTSKPQIKPRLDVLLLPLSDIESSASSLFIGQAIGHRVCPVSDGKNALYETLGFLNAIIGQNRSRGYDFFGDILEALNEEGKGQGLQFERHSTGFIVPVKGKNTYPVEEICPIKPESMREGHRTSDNAVSKGVSDGLGGYVA